LGGSTYSEDLLVRRLEREAAALGYSLRVVSSSTSVFVELFRSTSDAMQRFTQILEEIASTCVITHRLDKAAPFGWYRDFAQWHGAVRRLQAWLAPARRLRRVQLRECPKHRARTKRRRFIHQTRARLRARGAL
jgi:hypothetical protein